MDDRFGRLAEGTEGCRLFGAALPITGKRYKGVPGRPFRTPADIHGRRDRLRHLPFERSDRTWRSDSRSLLREKRVPIRAAELRCLTLEKRSYQSLLCEAALFALCAALRAVIVNGHLDLLKTPKTWKKWRGTDMNATLPIRQSTAGSDEPKGVVQFFRASPLVGVSVDLERDQDTGREVALPE
jgi:hypothetical protein